MLRIAVVEDDAGYVRQLQGYLERYSRESALRVETEVFPDGDRILEGYEPRFDVILMDVEMPLVDGMTAARVIRQVDPEVVIIFITNMAQYAIQGYAVDALDYVLKPVSYFAFSQRLDRAISRLRRREKHYITVAVKGGSQKLDVSQIYYVESQGHNLLYHTEGGEVLSPGTMQETEERLAPFHFFRGNKGYLINLQHVDSVREGCAVVRGERLLLSRARKNAFLEALTDYMGETLK